MTIIINRETIHFSSHVTTTIDFIIYLLYNIKSMLLRMSQCEIVDLSNNNLDDGIMYDIFNINFLLFIAMRAIYYICANKQQSIGAL